MIPCFTYNALTGERKLVRMFDRHDWATARAFMDEYNLNSDMHIKASLDIPND